MPAWFSDYAEAIIGALIGAVAGCYGTAKMFLGLTGDVKELKEAQSDLRDEVDQLKLESARAEEQRKQIKENTDLLIEHLVKNKSE